jgi:CDP-diacylglycerol--serine O-phosphatidyltransferase
MSKAKKVIQNRIYLLPNLLTTAGLFAAFYAIVAAMNGMFENSAIAIFIAMIADGLDGRVARLIGAQSEFGSQYDSIADMVAYGVAPALLTYSWSLSSLGKLGWLIAFFYTAAVALRLARFNVQSNEIDKRYFIGLNSPAGAGVVTSFVWFCDDLAVNGHSLDIFIAIVISLVAMLMVSNFHYYSFKEIDIKKALPPVAGLIVVILMVSISAHPPFALLLVFTGYAMSGLLQTYLLLQRKRRMAKASQLSDQPSEQTSSNEQ